MPIKKPEKAISGFGFRGGDDGIRTHDPHVANVMLSQLSYIPTGLCALSREDTFCLYRCVLSNGNLHGTAKYTRTASRRGRRDDTRPMSYAREYPPAGSQAPRTACRACVANSANLSGLDARKVHVGNAHLLRQLVEGNTAVGHDAIEPENDWHRSHLQRLVREFLQEDAILKYERKSKSHQRSNKGSKIYRDYRIITCGNRNRG